MQQGRVIRTLKFNKLNNVRHVAVTNIPQIDTAKIYKVSVHTRGNVAAAYPWDMYPQHFEACTCCDFVPTTILASCRLTVHYTSFLSLQHVPPKQPLVSAHLQSWDCKSFRRRVTSHHKQPMLSIPYMTKSYRNCLKLVQIILMRCKKTLSILLNFLKTKGKKSIARNSLHNLQ